MTERDRGYGWPHEQDRRRWARRVASGMVLCRSVNPILIVNGVPEPWDLGHNDTNRSLPAMAEHQRCNEPRRTGSSGGADAAHGRCRCLGRAQKTTPSSDGGSRRAAAASAAATADGRSCPRRRGARTRRSARFRSAVPGRVLGGRVAAAEDLVKGLVRAVTDRLLTTPSGRGVSRPLARDGPAGLASRADPRRDPDRLEPSEWFSVEWRDVDRTAGVVLVERTYAYGVTKSYGKTARSRRRVPLSTRAPEALDATPRRLDVRLVYPRPPGRSCRP